jgi:hypothetical protein
MIRKGEWSDAIRFEQKTEVLPEQEFKVKRSIYPSQSDFSSPFMTMRQINVSSVVARIHPSFIALLPSSFQ